MTEFQDMGIRIYENKMWISKFRMQNVFRFSALYKTGYENWWVVYIPFLWVYIYNLYIYIRNCITDDKLNSTLYISTLPVTYTPPSPNTLEGI
jgi:hypothetical protein